MSQQKRKLNVMFYKPPAGDVLLNRMVAFVDPPYSHVELCFEDGSATSIFHCESVFVQPRTYSNPNYTIVTLSIPAANYNTALQHCLAAKKRGVGFHSAGMYASLLPVQLVPSRDDATFCSRYVTEALQAAGVPEVQGQNSALITPSQLHRLISGRGTNMLDTVPARCSRLSL